MPANVASSALQRSVTGKAALAGAALPPLSFDELYSQARKRTVKIAAEKRKMRTTSRGLRLCDSTGSLGPGPTSGLPSHEVSTVLSSAAPDDGGLHDSDSEEAELGAEISVADLTEMGKHDSIRSEIARRLSNQSQVTEHEAPSMLSRCSTMNGPRRGSSSKELPGEEGAHGRPRRASTDGTDLLHGRRGSSKEDMDHHGRRMSVEGTSDSRSPSKRRLSAAVNKIGIIRKLSKSRPKPADPLGERRQNSKRVSMEARASIRHMSQEQLGAIDVAHPERWKASKERASMAQQQQGEKYLHEALRNMSTGHLDDGFSPGETAHMFAAFTRFKVPGEADLHVPSLDDLLHYLGCVNVTPDEIHHTVMEVTRYDYLDFDEFIKFMRKIRALERMKIHEAFDMFDADKSDEVNVTELRTLMRHLGFLPLRDMMAEALEAVDQDFNGQLSFNEFLMFLTVYHFNEGFTKEEVADLRRNFDRLSKYHGPNGFLLPPGSVCDALVQVFGIQVSEDAAKYGGQMESGLGPHREAKEISDYDDPVSLNFWEFLIVGRMVRQAQLEKFQNQYPGLADGGSPRNRGASPASLSGKTAEDSLQKQAEQQETFANVDTDHDGKVSQQELKEACQKLGYTPLECVLEELCAEVVPNWEPEQLLDFNEFFDFMLLLQQREGFLKAEVDHLKKQFQRFDEDNGGTINVMELGEMLRHMGYSLFKQTLHTLILQVDENGNGQLEFREMLRLMHLFRENELGKIRKVFDKYCGPLGDKTFNGHRLTEALRALGHDPAATLGDVAANVHATHDVDFNLFVFCNDQVREESVRKTRKKAGFTDQEISHFEDLFHGLDRDRNKTIDINELQKLLKEFGWDPHTREEQNVLMKKLDQARALTREAGVEDVGENGFCPIPFWVFVRLMRTLHNEADWAEEQRMETLRETLRYTEEEVEQFREVYHSIIQRRIHSGDEPEGELDLHHMNQNSKGMPVDSVIRLVRTLGARGTAAEAKLLDEKLTQFSREAGHEGTLDFAGFLKVMRWLMDTNFGEINQALRMRKVEERPTSAHSP
jgi:Ca2+-binding EF-hand superfamily protein